MDASWEISEFAEIFVFTDNQHAESAFYRGTAKSPRVLSLMFCLHRILMKGHAFIHIVWVAGRRMIDQGTDGLSRLDLTSGVMRGQAMLEFVPLSQTALERRGKEILCFLQHITGLETKLQVLTPSDWFTIPWDHDGTFLWSPPPCLADVTVYMLAEAQHIRPWNLHVFIVPSIMEGRWRKMLYKAANFLCVLPFGEELCPMHQNTSHSPSRLYSLCLTDLCGELSVRTFTTNANIQCKRCTGNISHSSGIICANFGYRRGPWPPCRRAAHGYCYRVFGDVDPFPRALTARENESDGDAKDEGDEAEGWEVTEKEQRDMDALYTCARPGDHRMTPFQCELCHFRNVYQRNPDQAAAEDRWVLTSMLWANLDAFWSRRPSTVANNLNKMQWVARISDALRLEHPFSHVEARPLSFSLYNGNGASHDIPPTLSR